MWSEMSPSTASSDIRDGCLENAVLGSEVYLTEWAGEDVDNGILTERSLRIALTPRHEAKPSAMRAVIRTGDVFEVVGAVIDGIAIDMVDGHSCRSGAEECLSDQPMNRKMTKARVAAISEPHSQAPSISCAAVSRQPDQVANLRSPSRHVATYLPKTGDRVPAFVANNGPPLLIH